MIITDHAAQRMAQRGVTRDDIETVMQYGCCLRRAGAKFYFMRHKDIRMLSRDQQALLHGLTAVMSRQNILLTVYKNPNGLRNIKKKYKYEAIALS